MVIFITVQVCILANPLLLFLLLRRLSGCYFEDHFSVLLRVSPGVCQPDLLYRRSRAGKAVSGDYDGPGDCADAQPAVALPAVARQDGSRQVQDGISELVRTVKQLPGAGTGAL